MCGVGRKEIAIFFYLFMAVTLLDFLLEGNFIQMSSPAYQVNQLCGGVFRSGGDFDEWS